ncbi:MAG: phosphatidylinositol mannoside acyltransferase [Pseudonocardiales bacterium]|nr:phosphatidylinositol mannoside acyltransferase [Solirubrobacterales bacterium]MBV9057750.1 phosphatidylinositol mannoside acyltransferase [Pseudonocardiales bacterium]MBV9650269.1 phosphatidylinositol mannoside acyltransferase [Pseudonocardiales bacterium]
MSRLADLGYAAGWRLLRFAPGDLTTRAFRAAADLAAHRGGPGISQLRRNLTRVVPDASLAELDALVRDGLRSYARYWQEVFLLPWADHAAVVDRFDSGVQGREHLHHAVSAGRGAVVVLPHSGNWDMAGLWWVHQHGSFSTVVERLAPEELYQRFVRYRASLGFDIIPLTGAGNPIPRLLRRLRAGGVVCLLGDRDITGTGTVVEFFGGAARMPLGPARLAAATGATLLVIGCWFTPKGWGARIHPPVPVPDRAAVRQATQTVADYFALDIAAHPQDWHMLQPLWLDDMSVTSVREAG